MNFANENINWNEIEDIVNSGRLTKSTNSIAELAHLVDQAIQLSEQLLVIEPDAFPTDSNERRWWLKLRYTEATATKMAAIHSLNNYVAGIEYCVVQCVNDYNARDAKLDVDETIRSIDTPFTGLYESINNLDPLSKLAVLKSICETVSVFVSSEAIETLAKNKPLVENGFAARWVVCVGVQFICTLVRTPLGRGVVNADSIDTLIARFKSLGELYMDEYVEELGFNKTSSYVLIDAESAISVALLELVVATYSSSMLSGDTETQHIEDRYNAYRSLLFNNRDQISARISQNEISSLVIAPESHDHWPSTIPEVEQLLRYFFVTTIATEEYKRLKLEIGPLICGSEKTPIIFAPPNYTFAPYSQLGPLASVIQNSARVNPFLLWIYHPSTLPNNGVYTDSIYTQSANIVYKIGTIPESADKVKATRKALIELSALGLGAAYTAQVIEASVPNISSEASLAIGAVATELVVRIASNSVKK